MILSELTNYLISYLNPLSLYVLIFLTGDDVMIMLSILSAQGFINLYMLIAICILANLSSDIMWFYFGKLTNQINNKKFIKKYNKVKKQLKRFKHPSLILFISKFVYGTRIITVMGIGASAFMSIWKFILIDVFALAIINILIILAGYYFGKTISYYFSNAFVFLFLALIFIILIFMVKIWIKKKFVR